jgi:hypothetical protein
MRLSDLFLQAKKFTFIKSDELTVMPIIFIKLIKDKTEPVQVRISSPYRPGLIQIQEYFKNYSLTKTNSHYY